MKLKQKVEWGKMIDRFSFQGFLVGVLLLVGLSFLGGILFYRSGAASKLSSWLRRIPQSDPVVQSMEELGQEIKDERLLYSSNGLPNVFLDVPFDSMLELEAKREEALALGVLYASDDDFVPATMRLNEEQTLDIKLRLKGDWVDHLEGQKWSFRIHVTEADGAVMGMRRFSLQGPQTRTYVSEWGFHQNLFMEDILTTRYYFVNVILNGEHNGIYVLEESFHEDLLESQGRRAGIIFRFNEEILWYDWGNLIDFPDHEGHFLLVDYPENNEITAFRSNKIAESEALSAEFQAAEDLLYSLYQGILSPEQVLDEAAWGKFFAITDLWAAGHGTRWHNLRFYYNPVTGLIEPIAFDNYVFHPSFDRDQLAYPFQEDSLFQTPGVQKAYVQTVSRIAKAEYLEKLKASFGEPLGRYYELLLEEYQDPALDLPWERLESRVNFLSRNINPHQPVRGNYQVVQVQGSSFVKLSLVNLMSLPVQLDTIEISGILTSFQADWCEDERCLEASLATEDGDFLLLSGLESGFTPISFRIPIEDSALLQTNEESVVLNAHLYGGESKVAIPIYPSYVPQGVDTGVKPVTTLAETLAQHSFLIEVGRNDLSVIPGNWDVTGDLVLPQGYDLLIPGDTTLRFGSGHVFLSYGSIDIFGSEESPVLITSQGDSWGGLVVLDADESSQWNYVRVERMGGISRTGWVLTGGITFYQSEIHITNAVIGENNTEDALNIIRTSFSFDMVEFLSTSSDAFDGDFTTGEITNCSFHDIAGDALDFSGSDVVVSESHFVKIGDKAISVGENSRLHMSNLQIRETSIGVASKDLSEVIIQSSTIDQANFAALAAYIKKPQYGPASLQADQVEVLNSTEAAICQVGSQILLNGELVSCQDIDVDTLYEQGILGN